MKARWIGPDRIEFLGSVREFGKVYDWSEKDYENVVRLVELVDEKPKKSAQAGGDEA